MRLPRHQSYKKSGCDRLGLVPAHWAVVPVRSIVLERNDRNEEGRDQNYLSLMANIGVIPYEEKGDVGNKKPDDLSKCKTVFPDDLVINSMNYGIGSYGLSPYRGVCSPVYIVLRVVKGYAQTRFVLRIFEDKEFQALAQSFGNGILAHRSAIGWDDLKGIKVALPPPEEQIVIAAFLDHETAKIDALIAEQQRLIELLKEKRQAVISHAVTKGLNPNAPMKDSGVEWLGQVPAHWSVRRLKNIVTTRGGGTPSKEVSEFWEGPIPWVSPKDMKSERIVDTIDHVSEAAIDNSSLSLIEPGAVLIVVRGMILLHSVPVAINDVAVTINQDMKALYPNRCMTGNYLVSLLRGIKSAIFDYVDSSAHGTRKIEWERMEMMEIPVPPLYEQETIKDFVFRSNSLIDLLMKESETAIKIISERRSAIISAAVSGKIDVRDWKLSNGE